jgi:hypothetical protein
VEADCRSEEGVFLGASALTIKDISDPSTMEVITYREVLSLAEDY